MLMRPPDLLQDISLGRMTKVTELLRGHSPIYHRSHPASIWVDPVNRKQYYVKKAPLHTLQADAFGLLVLQFHGVPVYPFTLTSDPTDHQPVLVSEYLESYVPVSQFPHPINWQAIQQGLLAELIIGEYNSKPENILINPRNPQAMIHLDQGGSLTSTASGKFKGLSPTPTLIDIEDVLYSFDDEYPNRQTPVNPGYEAVVSLLQGTLVFRDQPMAQQLLELEHSIPDEWYEKALKLVGYRNDEQSKRRLTEWITYVQHQQLPLYTTMPESGRKQQYLRWSKSALQSFQGALSQGGELAFYTKTLQQRRGHLLEKWEAALPRKHEDNPRFNPPSLTQSLIERWWMAWNTVRAHNHHRSNLYASAKLFVLSIISPEALYRLGEPRLYQPLFAKIPVVADRVMRLLISRLMRRLQHIAVPLSAPEALQRLEQITEYASTWILTTGDLGISLHHSLPLALFEVALPGGQEQLLRLSSSGVMALHQTLGSDRLAIHASPDKLAEVPQLVQQQVSEGKRLVVILDDRLENLRQADQLLARFTHLPVKLVLVNQGLFRQTPPLEFKPDHPLHTYLTIDSFSEAPDLVSREVMGIPAIVLCDFDGVITNNREYKNLQEQVVIATMYRFFRTAGWLNRKQVQEMVTVSDLRFLSGLP